MMTSENAALDPDPSRTLATLVARVADEKQGMDIVVLEVGAVLAICDHFVICSAGNTRLVAGIADAIDERVRVELGRKPNAIEGLAERRWVLLDYGDVVVHIFLDTEREYYRLEKLYGDVPRLHWAHTPTPAPG